MRTSLECIPCFIRQALDAAKMITSDEKILISAMKKVMAAMAAFDLSLTPPEAGQIIHRIIRAEVNDSDPYIKLKRLSTRRATELGERVKNSIYASGNSFETAVKFSIAGNIMDFGMKSEWDESHIMSSFKKAETEPVDSKTIQRLYDEIKNAKNVLVLGDNAGETVFDRLLIETFPGNARVFYGVKGSPVINDAVAEDAIEAGINSVAEILPNGTDSSGTLLHKCTPEFIEQFNAADVVIAKGQGNFETLNNAARKIYFLFQVKCAVIADFYNFKNGEWIVADSNEFLKNINGRLNNDN